MDRRQKKTRNAIFAAFIKLLDKKNYGSITVGEIIDEADVGRATFYSHFETKDYLLKALCEDLFDHVINSAFGNAGGERGYALCNDNHSPFLHLLNHLEKNDDNILRLLTCCNNELFLSYFKENLKKMITGYEKIESELPVELVVNHIANTFVETIQWWSKNKMKESPEQIEKYFLQLTGKSFSGLNI